MGGKSSPEYFREYRRRNAAKKLKQRKEDYLKNRARYISKSKEWRERNPEKTLLQRQRYNLKKRCGTTLEVKIALLEDQQYRCKICFKSVTLRTGHLDHIHGTNPAIVRGILCHNCNCAIGLMKDDAGRLEQAADYLREFE